MGHWGVSTHKRAQSARGHDWNGLVRPAMIAITPAGWYDWDSKSPSRHAGMVELQPTLQRADAGIGLVGMKAARYLSSRAVRSWRTPSTGITARSLCNRGFRPGNGPTRLSRPRRRRGQFRHAELRPFQREPRSRSALAGALCQGLIDADRFFVRRAARGYPSAAALSAPFTGPICPRCGRTVCRGCRMSWRLAPIRREWPTSWPNQQTPRQVISGSSVLRAGRSWP